MKNIKESSFNLDRTKNIIGKETFDAISTANKSQLEKWLSELQDELENETSGSSRYNKLKHEEQLIMYRLEMKPTRESVMKKVHPLQENYKRFFGNIDKPKEKSFEKLNESDKSRFTTISKVCATKYPNAPLTIKEGYVWIGNKKYEPVSQFMKKTSLEIQEMVRSFSNSQSKRLI